MVRPRKLRQIWNMPEHVYFKPRSVPLSSLNEVVLSVDEHEAMRLKDLEGMEQVQAAEKMGVHQSTFQRMLANARKKVTDALVNGKAIKIEGGAFKMPGGDGTGPMGQGPIGGRGRGRGAGLGRMGGPFAAGPGGRCVCPKCGHEQLHVRGVPCTQIKCEKCGSPMIRG